MSDARDEWRLSERGINTGDCMPYMAMGCDHVTAVTITDDDDDVMRGNIRNLYLQLQLHCTGKLLYAQ